MGRIKEVLLTLFATGTGLVFLALTVLSLPFNILVVMRWWAMEWWSAMIAVLIFSCIPGIGQLGYIVFTVIGAFFFYQAGFDWRVATNPSVKTFSVAELTPAEFTEFTRTVVGPQMKDYCIENAKKEFSFQGKVADYVPAFCGCYARVMFEQVTQKDWVEADSMKRATPALQERVTKAVETQCKP